MSKAAKKMKPVIEKGMAKINHGNRLKTYIPAGMAVAGPPLGPQLGQVAYLNNSLFINEIDQNSIIKTERCQYCSIL